MACRSASLQSTPRRPTADGCDGPSTAISPLSLHHAGFIRFQSGAHSDRLSPSELPMELQVRQEHAVCCTPPSQLSSSLVCDSCPSPSPYGFPGLAATSRSFLCFPINIGSVFIYLLGLFHCAIEISKKSRAPCPVPNPSAPRSKSLASGDLFIFQF